MITSVYVMLLRFVQRYHSSFIFREFKKQEWNGEVMCRFDEKIDDDLKSIFDDLRITLPAHLPRWLPVNAINPQVLLPEWNVCMKQIDRLKFNILVRSAVSCRRSGSRSIRSFRSSLRRLRAGLRGLRGNSSGSSSSSKGRGRGRSRTNDRFLLLFRLLLVRNLNGRSRLHRKRLAGRREYIKDVHCHHGNNHDNSKRVHDVEDGASYSSYINNRLTGIHDVAVVHIIHLAAKIHILRVQHLRIDDRDLRSLLLRVQVNEGIEDRRGALPIELPISLSPTSSPSLNQSPHPPSRWST